MSMINFLTTKDVLRIHQLQLEAYGGAQGIRDRSGLEAAVMQPQSTWEGEFLYKTEFDMAAVYAYHIAESQAFVDGNKRTALHSALLFLAINGYPINVESDMLYEAMIGIAQRTWSKEELSDLLRDLAIQTITGQS